MNGNNLNESEINDFIKILIALYVLGNNDKSGAIQESNVKLEFMVFDTI